MFVFVNAKCKKVASRAEQIIPTPNQLRSNVRKHLDSTPWKEKSWTKFRLLAAFWKCRCSLTVMFPWQQIRSYLFLLFFLTKLKYLFVFVGYSWLILIYCNFHLGLLFKMYWHICCYIYDKFNGFGLFFKYQNIDICIGLKNSKFQYLSGSITNHMGRDGGKGQQGEWERKRKGEEPGTTQP